MSERRNSREDERERQAQMMLSMGRGGEPVLNYEIGRKCQQNEVNCFAYTGRGCMALTDTNFGDRPCPFYKSKEQRAREIIARRKEHEGTQTVERND